ncbi:carotenoid oxygenase family protein [Gloeothece verrucosa]|uniref:Carotenoid oxygenase n=1 Tax=Gloeothece verrucosa (strain PCC 7822) TaxID=497965 RepID=E0UL59_GLOV7|nr:carotenoid oxygenase family protein [Gloeothece verrucosa]ADN17689.1 Carotenoid oxygenase [Gloeothece verrucosa PCC 7822]
MIAASQFTPSNYAWAKAFSHSATEFGPSVLPIITGEIPQGLRGSFYRNGPGCLERGQERIYHWFDGDGAILAVHFTDEGATGIYRYVQTQAYQAEEKAAKFFFGSYGRTPKGSIWNQLTLPVKNNANSGVLALDDCLLALWEAGAPYALNPKTLETLGLDKRLGLKEDDPYSTHPKQDPESGDIYNFGVRFGPKGSLMLYRSDATGKIQQKGQVSLDGLPLIHDFVLTKNYLIFFIPPVRLNLFPFLAKQKSFSDCLAWQPKKGMQILVIDRQKFTVVSQGITEPWFQWRFGNAYEDQDGTVVIDILRYDDFRINQFLQEVCHGNPQTPPIGSLWQMRLDPKTAKLLAQQKLVSESCEYPTFAPHLLGKPCRYTYLSLIEEKFPKTIGCFDQQTGILTKADLGMNCYPVSPIYAPDKNDREKGWILTEVFDGEQVKSEVWIFDALALEKGPVCRLALPKVVPFGFHGTWKAA